MIRRCEFDRALELIHRSGVHRDIEALLRPEGHGGRPRQLRVDVFLAGLVCTVVEKKTMALTLLHKLLTRDLARSYQTALGVRVDGQPITLRQVRYLLEAIEKKLAFTEDRVPELSEVDRVERRQALQRIYDRILAATTPEHLPASGAYATDASAVASAARGKRRPTDTTAADTTTADAEAAAARQLLADAQASAARASQEAAKASTGKPRRAKTARGRPAPKVDTAAPTVPAPAGTDGGDGAEPTSGEVTAADVAKVVTELGYSADPDARWGYQTRTYDNRTNKNFGYLMVTFTRIPRVGAKTDQPMLVERLVLIPGNGDPVAAALDTIDRLTDDGCTITEIADDRGFSYAVPENWAYQLRSRRIEQVLDLHANDRGVRDFEGLKMIDGWPHCPNTPGHLEVIVRPAQLSVPPLKKNATPREVAERDEKLEAIAEFRALIAERRTWAFRRTAGPDASGKEHYECPGRAGYRDCSHCPLSGYLPEGTPTVENPPAIETAPKCCTQRTVTVYGDVTPKIRQRLYWGSDEWIAAFVRRTRVEAGYGNLKSSKTENVRRGWTHVVGIVKTGLMLVIAQAAANLRCLRVWAARTGDRTDPLTWDDPEDYGFEELDRSGQPATGPPAA